MAGHPIHEVSRMPGVYRNRLFHNACVGPDARIGSGHPKATSRPLIRAEAHSPGHHHRPGETR